MREGFPHGNSLPFPCRQFCSVYSSLFTLCAPQTQCNPSEAEHTLQAPHSQQAVQSGPNAIALNRERFLAPCPERPPRSASGSPGAVQFIIAASLGSGNRTNVSRPAGQLHGSIACRQLSRIIKSDNSMSTGPEGSQKVCRVCQSLSSMRVSCNFKLQRERKRKQSSSRTTTFIFVTLTAKFRST